ncbi:MAG: hypothetical protein R2710_22390 [Acidimicrobiales bacterium]
MSVDRQHALRVGPLAVDLGVGRFARDGVEDGDAGGRGSAAHRGEVATDVDLALGVDLDLEHGAVDDRSELRLPRPGRSVEGSDEGLGDLAATVRGLHVQEEADGVHGVARDRDVADQFLVIGNANIEAIDHAPRQWIRGRGQVVALGADWGDDRSGGRQGESEG